TGSLHVRRHVSSRLFWVELQPAWRPHGLDRPATSSEGRPRRGGHAGHLEMAHFLISTRLPKIISSRYAENANKLGKPPFPDVQDHFHRYEACSNSWTSRAPCWRVGAELECLFPSRRNISHRS